MKTKIKVKALTPLIDRGVYYSPGEMLELERTKEEIEQGVAQRLYEVVEAEPEQATATAQQVEEDNG